MDELGIREIHELYDRGELTASELVTKCLERIENVDQKLNSIIEINPDAVKIAQECDADWKAGNRRGALHGIPVILKDNIDTGDKMLTTAGSLALEGNWATFDAHVVKLLRQAGAIILAKANLSEWANFRGQQSTSGWSSRGGQTHNPYDLRRNPCGSSSGSAVAVAANLCTVAIGTETDGSIICPSQTNGIVGIKPTIGLVSRSGIIPIAHSQDTAGPMGRTVEDAAILLGAMIGTDDRDRVTMSATRGARDYTPFLDEKGLQGARLAFSKKYMGISPKLSKVLTQVLERVREQGAEIIEVDSIPTVEDIGPTELSLLHFEYKEDLNKYLAGCSELVAVHSIAELIAFNKKHADRIMPYFGQEHLEAANEKAGLDSQEYLEAMEKYNEYRRVIDGFFEENKLNAILAPSGGPAWYIDHINGDCYTGSAGTSGIAAVTGFAAITVPGGYIGGLPVGISFIGQAFSESNMIKYAYAYEQATKIRRKPEL